MKKSFLFALTICSLLRAYSQNYWQQQVNYVIDVTLNDKEKTLDAFERITYINNSPDTLHFIWFHLWPNAYKSDRTAFSEQLLENGSTKFYFTDKEQKGYINRLDFKVDGATAKTEDHPQYIDVVKLILPKPLAPKQQVTITTPFHEKLPFNISRGGYDGESFQVSQWYPKPAVYDSKGWHPMPYLDQGEFYSEFGNFDVRITVPKNYVVAATGELQNEDEKQWLKKRIIPAETPVVKRKFTPTKQKGRAPVTKKISTPLITVSTEPKTLNYKQNNVHDFAWFANKDFVVQSDTCKLPGGKVIEAFTYYTPKEKATWKSSLQYAKDAVRFYSMQVGEYPYNVVSVVQGPESFGGGMEYPTITIISPSSSEKELDETITHEIGHNWFYGILASNERDHPWMDEGINTFYEYKYSEMKYGKNSELYEILFQTKAVNKTDQPIETPSEKFSEYNYNLVAYHKTAEWMQLIEQKVGKEKFKAAMHDYFDKWKFKHPQPESFKTVMETELKAQTDDVFSLLNTKGILPNKELEGSSVVSPLKKNSIRAYLHNPTKSALLISPVVGANWYDKLMVGALITNYKLPPSDFQFLITPMYSTGAHSFAGLGKLNYTIHSDGAVRKTDFFVNAATFSIDDFRDTAARRTVMNFIKIVPGIRLTFKEKDPRSTVRKYIQWKTFFINEGSLKVTPEVIVIGRDTSVIQHYAFPKNERYLNQLQFVYENSRALYPFDATLQIEQAQDFVRPTFTANYLFNYPKGGGLEVRFFAGKFLYLNGKSLQKQFANDRYLLNMTGPNGSEDYTYSDYFIGRNEFDNFSSQQIMIRDGAFKVRTDLLANKIGKTDDWLMAANFNTSIPQKINPLSVLPLKIPLRIFADIGTYAEPWQANSDLDKFLFDAGIHLPLLDEAINIYIPLFYSKVYSNYFKSTIPKNKFFKSISFSINLYNRDLKKLNREIEF